MRAMLLVAALVLGLSGCRLEQRIEDVELLPIGCRVDAECVIARIYEDSFCVPGCRDDADCPNGEVCGEEKSCRAPAAPGADAG